MNTFLNLNYLKYFYFFLGAMFSLTAQAQLRVEISGVGANQIPIAIASFSNEAAAPQLISSIIKADLMRSGMFKMVESGVTLSDTSPIKYEEWKSRGADALAVGSVTPLANGQLDIRYKLIDTIRAMPISSLSQSNPAQHLRSSAHKIADDIYEKLIGTRGAFATRIAYVTKSGRQYRLEVADSDGEGMQIALSSNEPIISPAWSADGTKVAYVSFESKKPVVWTQNMLTGERHIVANFKGSNSAPAWSPDGSKLAIALSLSGLTQIYTVNADGSGLQRLTKTNGIDTEPQFSPDGQHIYFTSDRSGGPQIYKMSTTGGDVQRVTFQGNYNISPRLSPDGKSLAYISRREGQFQLYLLDLANAQELRLSDTAKDESPSFSPNGKYIMYATESGRRGSLAVVSADGKVKYRLTTQAGDIREPTWAPFVK